MGEKTVLQTTKYILSKIREKHIYSLPLAKDPRLGSYHYHIFRFIRRGNDAKSRALRGDGIRNRAFIRSHFAPTSPRSHQRRASWSSRITRKSRFSKTRRYAVALLNQLQYCPFITVPMGPKNFDHGFSRCCFFWNLIAYREDFVKSNRK